jgi:hypothetical protein
MFVQTLFYCANHFSVLTIIIWNNFTEAIHRGRIRMKFPESGKYLVFVCWMIATSYYMLFQAAYCILLNDADYKMTSVYLST